MHKNIETVAGCLTRLTCEVITADGATPPELMAYVLIEQQSYPARQEPDGVLIFPAVDYGQHLYEVRADGKPVLFGHLLVRPSAFPQDSGVVDYALAIDASQVDGAKITLTLTPGPRGPQGETGPSAYQLAVAHGYAGTEADWVAELSGAQAAASAAKASEQAAATSAEEAAATSADTAKKTENNTFTGTNTFNGMIAANGGITGLPGPADATAALHQRGGALLAFTQQANTLKCSLSWTKTSTTGTVVAGGSVESAAIDVFAAGQAKVSYYRWGNYLSYTALYMPFTIENISNGGALHIALPFGTGSYGTRTMTAIGQPVIKYESAQAGNSLTNRHIHGVELIISRSDSTYSALVRGWKIAGTTLTGMREARFNLVNTMVPHGNARGISGVLVVRTSDTTAAIFLRSTYLSSVKWHAVGEVNVNQGLYAGQMGPVQVGVQGAKVNYMDSVCILAGAPCEDAAKVLRAETVTATVTDKTFDDYKTEYPA